MVDVAEESNETCRVGKAEGGRRHAEYVSDLVTQADLQHTTTEHTEHTVFASLYRAIAHDATSIVGAFIVHRTASFPSYT
jgi:O-acetyl-ADP-ribose deacetylase (regulator of RNase III)